MGKSDTATRMSASRLIEKTIDGIRQNLFWTALALVIIALAVAYVLLVAPIRGKIKSEASNIGSAYSKLTQAVNSPDLANDQTISAAAADRRKIDALYGAASLILDSRTNFLYDIPYLAGNPDEAHRKKWADSFYTPSCDQLTQTAQKEFGAPAQPIHLTPVTTTPKLEDIILLQHDYAAVHYILTLLQHINAQSGTKKTIDRLTEIRLGALNSDVHKHPWLRSIPVKIALTAQADRINQLIADLERGPVPFAVHTIKIDQLGFAGTGSTYTIPDFKLVNAPVAVEISGDLLEYLRTPQAITLAGFPGKKEAADWLLRQQQLLSHTLTLAANRIPDLKNQIALLRQQQIEIKDETTPPTNTPPPFELLFNFLAPAAPEAAYLAGPAKTPVLLIAKTQNGDWAVADYAAGQPIRQDPAATPDDIAKQLIAAGQATAAYTVATGDTRIAVLSNPAGPSKIIIAQPGKPWTICPILQLDNKPLIISQAAFLFPGAIQNAATNIRAGKPLPDDNKITFIPDDLTQGTAETYIIDITDPANTSITVTIKQRK